MYSGAEDEQVSENEFRLQLFAFYIFILSALDIYITLQFTGQPSVLYYAPTLFESIGYGSNTAAALQTVGLGIVKVS